MPHRLTCLFGATYVVILVGCPLPNAVCDPGETQDCSCAGGQTGAQACEDSGDGWEDCECGSGDDDDDATQADDDDAQGDDDDASGATLTVTNYTSYMFEEFFFKVCAGGENDWQLGCYNMNVNQYCYVTNLVPGCYDLWVYDVVGYAAEAQCAWVAAGGECYWNVQDADMAPW